MIWGKLAYWIKKKKTCLLISYLNKIIKNANMKESILNNTKRSHIVEYFVTSSRERGMVLDKNPNIEHTTLKVMHLTKLKLNFFFEASLKDANKN